MAVQSLFVWLTMAMSASALTVESWQSAACPKYILVNTRGTDEKQGPSAGFLTMNSNVQKQLPGGSVYNTVYPASENQNYQPGTDDIVREVNAAVAQNPKVCIILEGYSQGAFATVVALPRLTGTSFDAVKGVFLIGDPAHRSGLTCNVDNYNGTTTRDVNGNAAAWAGIPANWVSKSLDVCIYGDGICDTTHGSGVNGPHLQYPSDAPTQNLGTSYLLQRLRGS